MEVEKNALLDASAKFAAALAAEAAAVGGEGEEGWEEVHLVLTGSPRPTFAETNAWLLDRQQTTPAKKKKRNAGMAGSYSIADNNVGTEEEEGTEEEFSAENDLGDLIAECATDDPASPVAGVAGAETAAAAATDASFFRRHTFPSSDDDAKRVVVGVANDDAEKNGNPGPMVGHAVVNAISRATGVGLQSSRARLLQGTIDRPDWEQGRWTDGECVFGELVARCGLDSFENTAGGGRAGGADDDDGGGPAAAAAAAAAAGSTRLRKTTNLSAHLVTVPALAPSWGATAATSGGLPSGMGEETVEEIARGVLRCLKRRGGPPARGVYLVLPPDGCGGGGVESSSGGHVEEGGGGPTTTTATATTRAAAISSLLVAAFRKLERYNDMIGTPKLMSDARFEFVPVSI